MKIIRIYNTFGKHDIIDAQKHKMVGVQCTRIGVYRSKTGVYEKTSKIICIFINFPIELSFLV